MPRIFVNRDPELSSFKKRLSDVVSRSSTGLVIVGGEPGVGKSLFLDNFARLAEVEQGALVTVGAGSGLSGAAESYEPFRQIVEHLAGLTDTAPSSVLPTLGTPARSTAAIHVLSLLQGSCQSLLGTLVRAPSIGFLRSIGLSAPDLRAWGETLRMVNVGPEKLQLERGAVRTYVSQILTECSLLAPLVVIIDDLQWVDSASLDMLMSIPQQIPTQKILAIGTVREDKFDEIANVSSVANLRELAARLANTEYFDFGRTVLQRRVEFCHDLLLAEGLDASDEASKALAEFSGGNAFYAVETIRLTSNQPSPNSSVQPTTAGPSRWQIDGALGDVIAARIGKLPDEVAQLLEVASVEGQTFTVPVLAMITKRSELDVLDLLDRVLRREYGLVEDASLPQTAIGNRGQNLPAQFRFCHGLYCDYIYNASIGPARRAALHRAVAEALEQLYQNDVIDAHASELSIHFASSGEYMRACYYSVMAANRSLLLGDVRASSQLCKSGFDLLHAAVPDESSQALATIRDLYVTSAIAERVRGRFSEAGRVAEEGLAHPLLATDPSAQLMLCSEWARSIYNLDRDLNHADELLQRALALKHVASPSQLADLHRQRGIVKQHQGVFIEALTEFYAALNLLDALPANAASFRADVINNVGSTLGYSGRFGLAIECQSAAVRVSTDAGAEARHTLYLNDLAEAQRLEGYFEEARITSLQAEELAAKQGKAGALARSLFNQLLVRLCTEQVDEGSDEIASKLLARIESLEVELDGEGPTFFNLHIVIGQLALGRGDVATASLHLGAARAIDRGRASVTGASEMFNLQLFEAALAIHEGSGPVAQAELLKLLDFLGASREAEPWAWSYLRGCASAALDKLRDPATVGEEHAWRENLRTAIRRCSAPGALTEVARVLQSLRLDDAYELIETEPNKSTPPSELDSDSVMEMWHNLAPLVQTPD